MARIDIEIEDYLDEVDTKCLVAELSKRAVKSKLELGNVNTEDLIEEVKNRFFQPLETLKILKLILGLRPWHGKDSVINEIEKL